MRILAIGAHPDDIEIYMFGALAAWAAAGAVIDFAVTTDGSRGGMADPTELARIRRHEAGEAAARLGVTPRFLDFADGTLVADAALVGRLKEVIGETLPDLVLTHAANDYHGDHRALSDAVRVAASITAPVLHADTFGGVGLQATHYVDITPHFPKKAAAIRDHVSQDPERFVAAAAALNSFRARQCNASEGGFAEAYRFEPVFPFADIRGLLPPAPQVRPIHDRHQPWR